MATGLDLITAALRKCGVVASGETADASDADDALAEVNRLLGTWNAQGLYIHAHTIAQHTLIADQESYTIGGSGSPDFSATRPNTIERAIVFNTAGDTILGSLTLRDALWWADRRPSQATTTLPSDLFFNPTSPNGTLYFSPTPDAAYIMELYSWGLLTALTLAGTVSLPPGYEDTLVLSLTERLCPEYGKPVPSDIRIQALDGRAWLKSKNLRTPPVIPWGAGSGEYDSPRLWIRTGSR